MRTGVNGVVAARAGASDRCGQVEKTHFFRVGGDRGLPGRGRGHVPPGRRWPQQPGRARIRQQVVVSRLGVAGRTRVKVNGAHACQSPEASKGKHLAEATCLVSKAFLRSGWGGA